jgi:biopolymer transport protein ExbD
MARRKTPDVQENLSPNLIPMVDIMFLLLLFFMLGADMGQRENVALKLTQADKAKEEKETTEGEDPTTIVHVFHADEDDVSCATFKAELMCSERAHWKLKIRGKDYDPDETFKKQLEQEALESTDPGDIDPDAKVALSKRRVVIRADQYAPFGIVLKIIETCSAVKIYKVEIAAARPAPEDG